MKKLKRLLLIHWYNFEKQVIDFDTISFITGKNSSGKSTVIDALQIIILGDTNGSFFNKAANDKSARTLEGYLYGENGDDGGAGFRFKRNGEDFASYIAAEFEDTETGNLFTCGIVFDCFSDHTFRYRWFVLDSMGLPSNLFIDESNGTPFFYRDLKRYLESIYGKNSPHVEFTEINKEYRKISRGRFGNIPEKYRMLFRKAVPFAPISDIQQFITEYVCDVKDRIDIDRMKGLLEKYQQFDEDARNLEDLRKMLADINAAHGAYSEEEKKERLYGYIIHRADLESISSDLTAARERKQSFESDIAELTEAISNSERKITELSEEVTDLRVQKQSSDEYRSQDDLLRRKNGLASRMDDLENRFLNTQETLRSAGATWDRTVSVLRSLRLCPEDKDGEIFGRMAVLDSETVMDFDPMQAAAAVESWNETLLTAKSEQDREVDNLERKKDNLEEKIEALQEGIRSYPDGVSAYIETLSDRLSEKYGYDAGPRILADLVEIRDPEWHDSLEALLERERFTVFVPDEMFAEASAVLREMGDSAAGASVADMKLICSEHRIPVSGSVAELLETSDSDARAYMDHILSGIRAVSVYDRELPGSDDFMTADGILRKDGTLYRIGLGEDDELFIGRQSVSMMIEKLESDLIEVKRKIAEENGISRKINEMYSRRILYSVHEAADNLQSIRDMSDIDCIRAELEEVTAQLESLDLGKLERLDSMIALATARLKASQTEKEGYISSRARTEAGISSCNEKIRILESKESDKAAFLEERYSEEWRNETGEKMYSTVRSGCTLEYIGSVYVPMLDRAAKDKEVLRKKRNELRRRYLEASHMPYAYDAEDNTDYEKAFVRLDKYDLPRYKTQIGETVKMAKIQFQNDFIAKLKDNIETAIHQIEQLNGALKTSRFGTDTYRLTYKANETYRNYYNMITDPLVMTWQDGSQDNLFTSEFAEKYKVELENLFSLMVSPKNESGEKAEERRQKIAKFTDYKSYLEFDMMVKDDAGNEQRLSVTMKKKSGGETQVPFYIALLASFSEICRVNYRNQNNMIRLIILDEAFSKMDGERIRESIRLLRKFRLQAVFSAPSDKIQEIAPLVDSNTVVFRNDRYSYARNYTMNELLRETDEE